MTSQGNNPCNPQECNKRAGSEPGSTEGNDEGFFAAEALALLEAWISQRSEWTKVVFAVCSAAFGLVVTMLMGKDIVTAPPMAKTLLVLSAVAFAVGILACASTFEKGADLLQAYIKARYGQSQSTTSPNRTHEKFDAESIEARLEQLKSFQAHSLIYGVILLLLSGFLNLLKI